MTKKNKNKRKREQREEEERRRQLQESQKKPETVEVVDSWEDIEVEAPKDLSSVPRTIELPPTPIVEQVKSSPVKHSPSKPKEEEQLADSLKSLSISDKGKGRQDNAREDTNEAMLQLQSTMRQVEEIFKNTVATQQAVKTQSAPSQDSTPKAQEKSKEEVMAEREAKKKAKAASKAKTKSGDTSDATKVADENDGSSVSVSTASSKTNVSSETQQAGGEKTKEEIKAEREAKKKAKQAARAAAKDPNAVAQSQPKQPEEKPQQQPQDPDAPVKSKAELKAERRAKQEEQRAKKLAEANSKGQTTKQPNQGAAAVDKSSKTQKVPNDIQADRASVEKKLAKRLASQNIPPRTQAQKKVMLFSHLHQYEREFSLSRSYPVVGSHIHPAVMTLGLQLAEGTVTGSNARCVAFMDAMKAVVSDYTTPENSELSRDLNDQLKVYITFLKECRPLSVSMGNAIRFLKAKINSVRTCKTDAESKEVLIEAIDEFVHHNIVLAAQQISITSYEKIRDNDVILTYGW